MGADAGPLHTGKSELLLRLLIADLVGEAATRRRIGALREDVADLRARLAQSEASAEALPHRRKYLLLVNGFLRRLLDLHLELVDEVERELAPNRRRRSPLPPIRLEQSGPASDWSPPRLVTGE